MVTCQTGVLNSVAQGTSEEQNLKQLRKISEDNIPYRTYFELGTKKMPPVFLDDETYGKAIRSLIVVAADAVPINKERRTFYLAKRIAKPIRGWWELGGRILCGEPEGEAISRIVKREASIEVSPERFILVSQGRYFLKDRQQEPQNAGNDTLCYHFVVELTDAELRLASANLDEKEYQRNVGLQEFDRPRILKENVEQPILDLYDTVFP